MDNAEFVRLLKEELESKSFKYEQLENENESLKKTLDVKVWICRYLLYFYRLNTAKICY
jgi:cell shape-determining protein MreC